MPKSTLRMMSSGSASLVENVVVVELKTVRALDRAHHAQCINYLRASGLHLCLLFNFATPRLE